MLLECEEVEVNGQLAVAPHPPRRLPQLADAMDHEVIPLLGQLQQVVPSVNQLLDRAAQLSHMASRPPKVFRRPTHQQS